MKIINRLLPNQRLMKLKKVLSREISIDTLSCLSEALLPLEKSFTKINTVAIGLDANVILRLPTHPKGADIIDYLDQRTSPLILPSQTIQEFWNNNLNVIGSVGKNIKKKFDDLKKEAKSLGTDFDIFSDKMNSLLMEFEQEFGYAYDEKTIHQLKGFFEMLMRKAYVSSIDRMEFFPVAEMRKKTKTPPGFRDDGDGDFYVWIELLYGAMKAKDEGNEYDCLILVTNDAKPDWVRDGVPHPVLTAEVKQLLGVSLEIWKLDEFIKAIEKELTS